MLRTKYQKQIKLFLLRLFIFTFEYLKKIVTNLKWIKIKKARRRLYTRWGKGFSK